MHIEGDYLDGITSKRTKARLEVIHNSHQAACIHVADFSSDDHEKINLEYNELKIESRLGNAPREISFGQGQLFITDDNDAIDNLIKHHSKSHSHLHKLETNSPLILFSVIATLTIIWAVVVYGIPRSAEFVAFKLPEFATEKLGGSLTILDKTLFDTSKLDASRRQQIRELVSPYLAQHKELKPKVEFRSGMKANAFALPGGEIVFTDDFVNLVENDEELLAVLFHELGHLKHKHIIRRALQDSMITILVILITGDVDTVDLLTGIPTLILDLSYSREFEKEADKYALEQMYHFDIPIDHFAVIMQRLETYMDQGDSESVEIEKETSQTKKSISDFLSTHPGTDDRVKSVAQFKINHGID